MTENSQTQGNQREYYSPYWLWKQAVPKEVIDILMTQVGQSEMIKAGTDANGKYNERNTDVLLANGYHWFAGILANAAINSNIDAQWGYDVKAIETFQIARYKEGQFYNWHTDANILHKDINIRKLTVVCMLSEPNEFTGGELELQNVPNVALEKGDIIVFHSLIPHRVTPIVSGTRYTATTWLYGKRSI